MSLERLLGIRVSRRSLQSTVVASRYVDCGVNQGLISHTQSCGHSLLCREDPEKEVISKPSTKREAAPTELILAMPAPRASSALTHARFTGKWTLESDDWESQRGRQTLKQSLSGDVEKSRVRRDGFLESAKGRAHSGVFWLCSLVPGVPTAQRHRGLGQVQVSSVPEN